MRRAEHVRPPARPRRGGRSRTSSSFSIADSPSSGYPECAARPCRGQLARGTPRASRPPRRLSVGSPLIRNSTATRSCSPPSRRRCRALRRPRTRDRSAVSPCRAQSLGGGDLRGENALWRRMRRARRARSPSIRLGKNGGTQSKCVENTRRGSPAAAIDVAYARRPAAARGRSSRDRGGYRREHGRPPRLRGPSWNRCRSAVARAQPDLPDPRFELRARVGPIVAILDDHGRRERQSPFASGPDGDRSRAGHDDGAFGDRRAAVPASGLMMVLFGRSYTGVEPVSTVPAAITARALITAPS